MAALAKVITPIIAVTAARRIRSGEPTKIKDGLNANMKGTIKAGKASRNDTQAVFTQLASAIEAAMKTVPQTGGVSPAAIAK